MQDFRRTICLLLTACLVFGLAAVPANAFENETEDPLAMKDYESFGAAAPEVEITAPEAERETEPAAPPAEETEPSSVEETTAQPAEEPAEESEEAEETAEKAPEETPAETLPEETEPTQKPQEDKAKPAEKAREMPQYFQTDYPDVRFGSGTLANNGCSITSLAMVATYMTGHHYRPEELARYFGGAAENNIARLKMGSEALQLPYYQAQNWHEAYAALENGKIVIVLVDNRSAFTQSQHFIILTGINAAGKIMVRDSYEPNYEKWELKKGFQEGFAEADIICGYSGAWVYDVDAVPEDPYFYSEPEPVRGEPRYPGIKLTLEQEDLLAKVIWVESRGESKAGQQAVAEVVLNRLESDRFPDNLHDVIYGEGQFRSAKFLDDAQPHQAQYEAIERALYGPGVLPKNVYYFATFPTTENIWGQIGGHIFCYAQD